MAIVEYDAEVVEAEALVAKVTAIGDGMYPVHRMAVTHHGEAGHEPMSGARLPLARASFWLAFLVVLAGSVVRMTGSGMGCPDWPKCFGLLVPPTEASQVTWTPGAEYDEGRMLVKNDTLWVAQSAFVARDFDVERARGQWQPYLKHDYATFNAAHTWIEFINRCLGALAGIPALLLLLAAALSRDLRTTLLALLGVLALGFVAWLGKLVVDGNLIPHSITIHMLGALAILCIDSVIIQRLRGLTVRWQRSARWGLGLCPGRDLGPNPHRHRGPRGRRPAAQARSWPT